LNFKDLAKYMLFSFLIIFFIVFLSAYILVQFVEGINAIAIRDLTGMFAIIVLTNLCQGFLYSKKELHLHQIILRGIFISLLAVTVIFIVAVYMGWVIFFESHHFIPWLFALFTFFGIAIVFLTTLILANNKLKSKFQSKEKEYYFNQCQLMQKSIEHVKSIRHDMKHHLITLKGYLADNHEATDYLNRLLGSIRESEICSATGNIAFDSIINFKLDDAKENNIQLDIKILIPSTLSMEIADIVTIMGNLLDNALDAVAKVEDKLIKLDVFFDKGYLYINVTNTFDGKIKHVHGNSAKDSTIISRKDAKAHGYGLKNIKSAVDKYNGHMEITYEDNVFSVGILVYTGDAI